MGRGGGGGSLSHGQDSKTKGKFIPRRVERCRGNTQVTSGNRRVLGILGRDGKEVRGAGE